ncbi:hypothetical protein X756_31375 [Mesorhizobium sp. LSHC412B00]|nr:hypothetical protein X756_31375 [Mesorhizobium sp. LSHC412B00]
MSARETAAADLPDDVDALKAMVLALTEKAALLDNQAARNERHTAERIAISDSRAERQKRASRPPTNVSPP